MNIDDGLPALEVVVGSSEGASTESMRRLASALFWVVDGVAWLMVVAFVAFGIAGPLVVPIVLRMRSEPPPSLMFLVGWFLWFAVAALACYLIVRRRLVGAAVMLAACSAWLVGFAYLR